MIKSFLDLNVYKESYNLALIINKAILRLPNIEKYDLTDQMRRASKSIPSNIAEGYAKRLFEKEFRKYIFSAIGSCNEMVVHISFARDLDFWRTEFCQDLINRYDIVGKQLTKLMQNWKSYPTSKV
jgi:four helix bundle protein